MNDAPFLSLRHIVQRVGKRYVWTLCGRQVWKNQITEMPSDTGRLCLHCARSDR